MKRLVIAIDCDDVLVATTPFFIEAYNKKYGTSIQLSEVNSESFDVWQADAEEIGRRLGELMETDEYQLLAPTTHEIEALRELAQYHELHLVTARKELEREMTQAMLDRELAGVFTSMQFVGWTGSKGEVCKQLGAHMLIDDNVRHLHDAMKNGIPSSGVVLYGDYAWNTPDDKSSEILRCATWADVKLVVEALANER